MMSPVILTIIIWAFSTLCGSKGVLLPPRNVNLSSYNMDLVLRWDASLNTTSGVVYTAEYKTSVSRKYSAGCVNGTGLSCDFIDFGAKLHLFATYNCRVRSELGSEQSIWVESNPITLDRDTIIGPPTVSAMSSGSHMEVSITDPQFRFSALKDAYGHTVTYNITYWKEGHQEKAESLSGIQQNFVVLNELHPRTRYCVQVQILTVGNSRPGLPSNITCHSTSSKEEAPWVAAVVTVVVLATVVAVVVLAVVYRRMISNFLCPKDSLPQHFKEYLLKPPHLPLHKSPPPEEVFHQMRILSEVTSEGEVLPLEQGGLHCSKRPESATGGENDTDLYYPKGESQ